MKYSLLTLLIVLLIACKPKESDQSQSPTIDSSQENTETVTNNTAKKYTLKPFAVSEPYHDAKILFKGYKNGLFDFHVQSETYKLGVQTPDAPAKMCANSDQGQHIHLIVDNAPYAAKYVADFDYDVEDGTHYILAFLSRSYHESIKTPDARIAMKAEVKDKAIVSTDMIAEPMIFYSRPKGTYVGKANTDKVMLDFYLNNVNMVDGYKVVADINGEEHIIETWEPYYIEGLPIGKNTITLTLVDNDGNTVDTPLNPVTREFELKEDPADAM
ncbi:MAG: phosphopeptide-binding protein [Saprospiraceae bacterium]|nr:phosphopeptide-binding protein [Saprospiraceae bacterium]